MKNKGTEQLILRAKLTKDFKQRLKEKAPDWKLVGEYTNARTRTLFKHKPCGHVYEKTPFLVTGKPQRCQYCNAKRMALSHDEFLKRVKNKMDRYEILSKCIGFEKPITIRHKICGETFTTTAGVFMKSEEGCPYCKNKLIKQKHTLSTEQFIKKNADRWEEYELLSEYKSAKDMITVKHKKCGKIFEVRADNFSRGSRCKDCKYSTGEALVKQYIETIYDGEIETGNRDILPYGREIDIYLPDLKIGFEYDGVVYHTSEHLQKSHPTFIEDFANKYHEWKTVEADKKGVILYHIFEDEWTKRRDIVEDKIKSILKVGSPERIYARNTLVRRITVKEARPFLEANHIQGGSIKSPVYGLFLGDRLVAVQSYEKQDKYEYSLTRYATLLDTTVIGGFSKCLKAFQKEFPGVDIISFADLRWTNKYNNVYLSNGFVFDKKIGIDYYYVKGMNREHKSNYRKARIAKKHPDVYSPDKTEREMMEEAGYRRIYDCGKIKYRLKA